MDGVADTVRQALVLDMGPEHAKFVLISGPEADYELMTVSELTQIVSLMGKGFTRDEAVHRVIK